LVRMPVAEGVTVTIDAYQLAPPSRSSGEIYYLEELEKPAALRDKGISDCADGAAIKFPRRPYCRHPSDR